MKASSWSQDFKENAFYRLEENIRMIHIAFSKSTNEDIWQTQNEVLNTPGNLILHLCGNMTQYIISGLGIQPDTRDRDSEFEKQGDYSIDQLLEKLTTTVYRVKEVIQKATDEQLLTMYTVQGFELSGMGLILHIVEHFSYHTGQIAFQVKLNTNKQLGFYDGMDLNKTKISDDL